VITPVIANVVELGCDLTYSAGVIEAPQRGRLLRHWPLLVAITEWVIVAWVPTLFQSEIVRLLLALTCMSLMVLEWVIYRKTIVGSQFLLLYLIVAWFTLTSLWLALNVLRYYTYNPESQRIWAGHTLVSQIQIPVALAAAVLMPVVILWVLILFAGWISGRIVAKINKART
jgi:hypothetical protein